MDRSTLENCIATLKKLRDVYESQLDASVLGELGEVIAVLEICIGESTQRVDNFGSIVARVLGLIDVIVRIVSNLDDLMK